jgi:integrase
MMVSVPGIKVVHAKGDVYLYHRATGIRITAKPGTTGFLKQVWQLNEQVEENRGPPSGSRAAGTRLAAEPGTPDFLKQVSELNERVEENRGPPSASRATGTRLAAGPGAPDFVKLLSELNERIRKDRPDTFGGLWRAYKETSDYTGLGDRTREDYRGVVEYLQPLDAMPLALWDPPFVSVLVETVYQLTHRRFANYVLSVVGMLFRWGIPWGITQSDPTQHVKPKKRPRDAPIANRAWRDEEIDAFLARAPLHLLVAFAISLFTGLREADVVSVPWTKYIGATFVTRARKNGEPVEIPAHPMLRRILDGVPRLADTIVTGAKGRELTLDGFKSMFRKFVKKLAAAGVVGQGLTFHGLRHTIGKMLAEAGCSTDDIMLVLAVSREMAALYSKEANRAPQSRAAIERLAASSAGKWKTGRERVENQFADVGPIGR